MPTCWQPRSSGSPRVPSVTANIQPSDDEADAVVVGFAANHGPVAAVKRGANVTTAQLSGLKDLLAEMIGLELRQGLSIQNKPSGLVVPGGMQH